MYSERKSKRFNTQAQVRIGDAIVGDAVLKNLSITGCCVECTMVADIKPNVSYQIEILPEGTAGIGKFEVTVESRWIRTMGYSCEIGFMITASPKGKLFQRYVDYLTYRSSTESPAD
jgi:hypothetical protein